MHVTIANERAIAQYPSSGASRDGRTGIVADGECEGEWQSLH